MKRCLTYSLLFFFLLLPSAFADAIDIAIIVHQDNPLDEISSRDLSLIFKREKQFWMDNNSVFIIMQEDGSLEKNLFVRKIFKMRPQALKRYWLAKIFRGEISSFPKTLSSNNTIKRFVSQIHSAIAYVKADAVDESVKVLHVDGKKPGEKGYFLSDR